MYRPDQNLGASQCKEEPREGQRASPSSEVQDPGAPVFHGSNFLDCAVAPRTQVLWAVLLGEVPLGFQVRRNCHLLSLGTWEAFRMSVQEATLEP